jgi:hypothetical protein
MHKYFSISSFYQTVIAFITMGDGYITLLLHGVSSEVRKKSTSESYWLIMQDSCFRNTAAIGLNLQQHTCIYSTKLQYCI